MFPGMAGMPGFPRTSRSPHLGDFRDADDAWISLSLSLSLLFAGAEGDGAGNEQCSLM
jgi:hypothetical protein